MKKLTHSFSDYIVLISTIGVIGVTLTCLHFVFSGQTNSSEMANRLVKENFALYLIYAFSHAINFMALPLFLSLGETFKNLSSRFTNHEPLLRKISYGFLGFSVFYSVYLSLILFYLLVKLSGGDLDSNETPKLVAAGLLTIISHFFIAAKSIKKNLFVIYTMYLALYIVLFSWVLFYHIKAKYMEIHPLFVILALLPFCVAIIYFAQRKLELWAKISIYSGIIFWLSMPITNSFVQEFQMLNKPAMSMSLCAVFVYLLICYFDQKRKSKNSIA